MIRCTFKDYGELLEILNNPSLEVKGTLMSTLRNPDCYIFTDEKYNICIMYLPIDSYKYNVHLYRKNKTSGCELKEFIYSTGYWMFQNTQATVLMNFVDERRRDLKMLMGAIGSTKISTIKQGGGKGDQTLYCAFKGDF